MFIIYLPEIGRHTDVVSNYVGGIYWYSPEYMYYGTKLDPWNQIYNE